MNDEISLISLSSFIFGLLSIACFKPLRHLYFHQEIVQKKLTKQESYLKNKLLSQELRQVSEDFDKKYEKAIKGKLYHKS